MAPTRRNIVILISGNGTNMAAIVQAAEHGRWQRRYGAHVAAVISNRADANGLQWAQQHGIATVVVEHKAYGDRAAFDRALAQAVESISPHWWFWLALCAF